MRDPVEHVQELAAGIGPRGATTEGERRGAEYARREPETLRRVARYSLALVRAIDRRHAGSQDGQ